MTKLLLTFLTNLPHSAAGGLKRDTVTSNPKSDAEYWRKCVNASQTLSIEDREQLMKDINAHETDCEYRKQVKKERDKAPVAPQKPWRKID